MPPPPPSVTHLLLDDWNRPQRNVQRAQSDAGTRALVLLFHGLAAQGSTPVIRYCTKTHTWTCCICKKYNVVINSTAMLYLEIYTVKKVFSLLPSHELVTDTCYCTFSNIKCLGNCTEPSRYSCILLKMTRRTLTKHRWSGNITDVLGVLQ